MELGISMFDKLPFCTSCLHTGHLITISLFLNASSVSLSLSLSIYMFLCLFCLSRCCSTIASLCLSYARLQPCTCCIINMYIYIYTICIYSSNCSTSSITQQELQRVLLTSVSCLSWCVIYLLTSSISHDARRQQQLHNRLFYGITM